MAKYRPSLKGLDQSFEKNYMLITRLLGDMDIEGDERYFFITDVLEYKIAITEKTKYTHVVEFKQLVSQTESLASKVHLPKPSMTIRIYHDARLAEVIESQYIKQIKPRYDYPNQEMHLPDEKQQTQHFLTEWLHLCLTEGKANIHLDIK
ncbi:DUF1249 domain-containing protein [Thalassotalea nanhaiensis]|uniref:DUF1249 domain-containing protein n=1 Tax=Thalassotalea nanhaiensis TaxID=3065648 RepID=A0ABY9TKR4_9GAMM|nr:DUF1249 domain-containing protein [Colwelliaceae bacterium SQ345]